MPHQATVDETQTREPMATRNKSIKTMPNAANDNADSTDHTKPNPQSTNINVNVNDQSSPRPTATQPPSRTAPLNLPPSNNLRPLRPPAPSAAFSLLPILYLASTHLGLGLDLSAEALATSFGSLPWIVKSAVKFRVAWIFTFHGLNSLRFLAWKFAIGVTNKEVAVTGWWVVVGSVAGAAGLTWYV
jgi:succinate dehydrogenase/fumarate reductase cytochrome b subunit